jgi:hypothetical protein
MMKSMRQGLRRSCIHSIALKLIWAALTALMDRMSFKIKRSIVEAIGMTLRGRSSIAGLIVCLALGVSGANVHAASLNLSTGWTLLGNGSSAAIDVATTFNSPASFATVWKWNATANKWAFYTPLLDTATLANYTQNKGYEVLTSIAPKEGFWVNASTNVVLTLPDALGVTLAAADLQMGWNLTSSADNLTPSQLNAKLKAGLNAANKSITTVWAWDAPNALWMFYAPSLEAQGGTALTNYITSKGYLPFNAALSATDGFWMNIGAVTPANPAIVILMNEFAGLFSAGLPTQAAVMAKLDPSSFFMDGMNAAAYGQQVTTAPSPVAPGDYFVMTVATLFDNASQGNANANIQWLNATQFNAASAILGESRVKFVNVSGIWLMAGNERAVRVNLRAESAMAAATATIPATFSSDINISVDPTTAAVFGSGVASAWVSGPSIVPSSPGVQVYSNAEPSNPGTAGQSVIPLCDSTIVTNCTNAVDGSEYTITLQDASGGVVATYKEALRKAPLPGPALNATMFPSIVASTPATIAGVAPSAAMSFSWTNPTGLVSNWFDFTVWDSNGQLVFQQAGPPPGNTFSGTMPAFVPPGAGSGIALSRFDITIEATDAYGRQYFFFQSSPVN